MHQGIAALLGLQSWIIYRVERTEEAKEACCPACGARTRRVWGRASPCLTSWWLSGPLGEGAFELKPASGLDFLPRG